MAAGSARFGRHGKSQMGSSTDLFAPKSDFRFTPEIGLSRTLRHDRFVPKGDMRELRHLILHRLV